MDPRELIPDVGDVVVLLSVAVDDDGRLVEVGVGHDRDNAGVLEVVLGGVHPLGDGGGEVAELGGMPGVYGGGVVACPAPVARRPGNGKSSSRRAAVGGWRANDGGWRGRRGVAVHEEKAEAVLLHAGLVGGWRGTVLELTVQHAGVGVVSVAAVRWPRHETAVAAFCVGVKAHHGTAGRCVP